MFNDVTNNVIIPAAGAKSSENLKLEIIRTLEQLNYQGNCLPKPHITVLEKMVLPLSSATFTMLFM